MKTAKAMTNPFEYLCLPPRPDLGDESRDFESLTIHRWREENIQLRVRRHRDGFSAGWHVIMPASGELNVFPTTETGSFKDERDARLFALGYILTQRSVRLTPAAEEAVKLAIAQWRQMPLF